MFFSDEQKPHRAGEGTAGPLERQGETHSNAQTNADQVEIELPGLLGEISKYIFNQSPYPSKSISNAGAIGLLSGICGRSYNVSGAGLNQYMLVLANTGMGKEAIASGTSKLMAEVQKSCPAAAGFRGPGQLVSSAGVIKWLDKHPAIYVIIGEAGIWLNRLLSRKASTIEQGLKGLALDLYGKSGAGNALDPMAYSDAAKNTGTIASPSLTIIGESVPEAFLELADESMVASGLLPRFMVFQITGKRPYANESPIGTPPPALVSELSDLCAHSLSLGHNGQVQNVAFDPTAAALFRKFEHWTTDQINGAGSEASRQLWNRANLKALKLAAIYAISINRYAPVICHAGATWATGLIATQTQALLAKFDNGEVGEVAGDEGKQQAAIMRAIAEYTGATYDRWQRYHGTFEMHRDGVVTLPHIMQRLRNLAAFKHDRLGATKAIERALKSLLDGDQLREIPKSQMMQKYGSQPKAYVISHAPSFVEALKGA